MKKTPRITNTIKYMLEYKSDIYLVAREWFDIEPEMEFRCFVYKGTLTAISQYFQLNILNTDNIKRNIITWWKDNKKLIPYVQL